MFTPQPIGFIRSPFNDAAAIPKGPLAKHPEEGELEILPAFAAGLTDIEGFSHLIVLWVFDRLQVSEGFDLMVTPPTDSRPHGLFTTRSPRRPNPIAPRRHSASRARHRYAGRHAHSGHQAIPLQHSCGEAAPWLAGRGRSAQQMSSGFGLPRVSSSILRWNHLGLKENLIQDNHFDSFKFFVAASFLSSSAH
jgi:tRNA-Thr(GGU) m(6)t(6)A37 methyltransferase TsaA